MTEWNAGRHRPIEAQSHIAGQGSSVTTWDRAGDLRMWVWLFQAPNMKALMSSATAYRGGSASGMVATARLTGQTIGAALAALCFGLVGREGSTLALVLGAVFAAVGCGMSVLRLVPISQRGA